MKEVTKVPSQFSMTSSLPVVQEAIKRRQVCSWAGMRKPTQTRMGECDLVSLESSDHLHGSYISGICIG